MNILEGNDLLIYGDRNNIKGNNNKLIGNNNILNGIQNSVGQIDSELLKNINNTVSNLKKSSPSNSQSN